MALSKYKYSIIRKWMYRNARPLELSLFQYHFEQKDKDRVLEALSAFQNEDGGFGHGLLADCFNPNSSPMQTWSATEVLYAIGERNASGPIVKGILEYLYNCADYKDGIWPGIIPSNNDYPHADPWIYDEENTFSNCSNPSAALAGFILYFEHKGSRLYKRAELIASDAVKSYLSGPLLKSIHESLCLIRLLQYCKAAEINHLFDMEEFEHKLRLQVKALITKNIELWKSSSGCKPSQFFHSSESIFYRDNKEAADYERRFILQSTNAEGIWDINSSWSSYPQEEAISSIWCKSIAVISNLRYLKGMGQLRLEDIVSPGVTSH